MNFATSSTRRGFTLIELLVVIAIIGILSAVVLASLNTARSKGADASIKSNLKTIQTQAELYHDTAGNKYHTTFSASAGCTTASPGLFADTTVRNAMNSAISATGGTALSGTASTDAFCAIGQNGASYTFIVKLKSTPTQYFCVDSYGNAVATTSTALGGGASADTLRCIP